MIAHELLQKPKSTRADRKSGESSCLPRCSVEDKEMLRPVRRAVKVIAGCGFREVSGTIMRRAVLRA